MQQGLPPVTLILREDKTEKDRQLQKEQNELRDGVNNSGHRCLFLINSVREKLGSDVIGPII